MTTDLIPIEVRQKMREQGIVCLEKKMDAVISHLPYHIRGG